MLEFDIKTKCYNAYATVSWATLFFLFRHLKIPWVELRKRRQFLKISIGYVSCMKTNLGFELIDFFFAIGFQRQKIKKVLKKCASSDWVTCFLNNCFWKVIRNSSLLDELQEDLLWILSNADDVDSLNEPLELACCHMVKRSNYLDLISSTLIAIYISWNMCCSNYLFKYEIYIEQPFFKILHFFHSKIISLIPVKSTFWPNVLTKFIIIRRVRLWEKQLRLYRSSPQRCSVKMLLLKISQNSQENTSARVSF